MSSNGADVSSESKQQPFMVRNYGYLRIEYLFTQPFCCKAYNECREFGDKAKDS